MWVTIKSTHTSTKHVPFHTKRATSNDVALFTFKMLHGKFIPKVAKAPQSLGKTNVQTVIAHKLVKRLGQHAAALQIAKKAIENYVVTHSIKIAVAEGNMLSIGHAIQKLVSGRCNHGNIGDGLDNLEPDIIGRKRYSFPRVLARGPCVGGQPPPQSHRQRSRRCGRPGLHAGPLAEGSTPCHLQMLVIRGTQIRNKKRRDPKSPPSLYALKQGRLLDLHIHSI